MDKSWMFLPRQTEEYRKGLESFLNFAFRNANINETIACPCVKCKIGICVSRKDAYDHLIVDGFIKGYTDWVAHGEIACSAFSISSSTPSRHYADDMEGLVHEALGIPQHDDNIISTLGIEKENEIPTGEAEKFYKLSAMEELANQLPGDSDDQVGQDDIFSQIIGPDRPGRVCMFGDGVSPSDLWGDVPRRSTSNRIVMEQKSKLEKIDEQVRKQGQHIAMLEAKISNQLNQNHVSSCTPSSNDPSLSVPARLSLRIGCSVSIKSLFDNMKVVAKGVVRSMDPNSEVGRQKLGPNWSEIQVLVILEPEESLIRPYDFLQKFGDALGGMIAWPIHLLTVNEDFF